MKNFDTVDVETGIETKDNLVYRRGSDTPFTGAGVCWHMNGQKKWEVNYKDGNPDGLVTVWYDNGQKEVESNWKDGKKEGLWTRWYENGQKASEGNVKDGRVVSRKEWDKDGNEINN